MAQNKFTSWVKMLVNPLNPDIFNSHPPEMLILDELSTCVWFN